MSPPVYFLPSLEELASAVAEKLEFPPELAEACAELMAVAVAEAEAEMVDVTVTVEPVEMLPAASIAAASWSDFSVNELASEMVKRRLVSLQLSGEKPQVNESKLQGIRA